MRNLNDERALFIVGIFCLCSRTLGRRSTFQIECDKGRVSPECKAEILMMTGLYSSLKFLPYTLGGRPVEARFK